MFRKILVPYDFSEPATRALETAAELARAHNGRLLLLNVIVPFSPITALPPGEAPVWVPPAELVGEQRKRLAALAARVVSGRRAPRVECRVTIGDPFQRIIDAAREADAIVMATAGRTGLSHLLIGSVAEKVVRHAPVPVLTVRAGRRKASRRPARRKRRS